MYYIYFLYCACHAIQKFNLFQICRIINYDFYHVILIEKLHTILE